MKEAITRRGYTCHACNGPVDAEDSICLTCNAERRGAWPVDAYVGRTVGRKYRIDRRISAGASGIVFAATQMHAGTDLGTVIVKMLPTHLARDGSVASRFASEARAARTLTNAHVVRVFDLDLDAGQVPYLVQEYVEGEPLSEIVLEAGKLDPARALMIAMQIAEGMEEAHSKGILHRNLGPTNILVRTRQDEDFVKIIGFGHYLPAAHGTIPRAEASLRYLAPEQIEGKTEDERTDIHALGLILHEMLSGRLPDAAGPKLADLTADPDPNLIDVVSMMLDPDPGGRPQNMRKVVALLEQTAEELGLNLDITGRFKLPSGIIDPSASAEPEPPEIAQSEPMPRGARARRSVHPGVVALAIVAGLILATSIILGVLRVTGLPSRPGPPAAVADAVSTDVPADPDALDQRP